MNKCCICQKPIQNDDAPLLAMGAVGNPKLLCDECDELLNKATTAKEYDVIDASMDEISERMAEGKPDATTFRIVSEIMKKAAERAMAIKIGQYDFSLDDEIWEDEDGMEEIPEELLETEEDRERDLKDEEKMKKFDMAYNIILIILIAATVGVIAYRLIDAFLLK